MINGESILKFYMEHPEKDYIFEWNPEVSKEKVQNIVETNSEEKNRKEVELKEDSILRLISSNDIRARILPIPVEIFEVIKDCKEYKVVINNEERKLNINSERRYFGGVTEIYKNAGYIDYKGKDKKKSYWKIDKDKIFVEFE